MSKAIRIDYALATARGVGEGRGPDDAALEAAKPAFSRARQATLERVEKGELGFWGLPADREVLRQVDDFVAQVPESIRDIVVLGIGGSSLGARAMLHALGGPPDLAPEGRRRLHLPDNSDPWLLSTLLERLDPRQTIAVVISKSGGTVETIAQLLVIRAWLGEAIGADAAKRHLVLITDPERGPLRALANDEGIPVFGVPPNVGGRFSVLTAVGLVPTRLLGFDAAGLLAGAGEMADACRAEELRENPAGILATLHHLHHRDHGRGLHVLMPYADALRPFAAWYVQLWAESLGKRLDRGGKVVETGPTPIPAVGATDQHAQMQLFMEGPRDKILTFIGVDEVETDIAIPDATGPFAYLSGRSLSEVLDAELRGTALALANDGRPSITLRIGRVDARSLGALFFLYQAATAFAGELYGVDAFDQPGVELGKRLASGLLGRPGFEDARDEVQSAEARLPDDYRV